MLQGNQYSWHSLEGLFTRFRTYGSPSSTPSLGAGNICRPVGTKYCIASKEESAMVDVRIPAKRITFVRIDLVQSLLLRRSSHCSWIVNRMTSSLCVTHICTLVLMPISFDACKRWSACNASERSSNCMKIRCVDSHLYDAVHILFER